LLYLHKINGLAKGKYMKKLLLLIVCLSAQALIGSEPPSSRDVRNVGKESFLKRLKERIKQTGRQEEKLSPTHSQDFLEVVHPAPAIPRLQALSPKSFRNFLDAALKKLDQRQGILK
jgi:hypothetical protein